MISRLCWTPISCRMSDWMSHNRTFKGLCRGRRSLQPQSSWHVRLHMGGVDSAAFVPPGSFPKWRGQFQSPGPILSRAGQLCMPRSPKNVLNPEPSIRPEILTPRRATMDAIPWSDCRRIKGVAERRTWRINQRQDHRLLNASIPSRKEKISRLTFRSLKLSPTNTCCA